MWCLFFVLLFESSTCLPDCIPAWFLRAVFQTVDPEILAIINCSLSSGLFPSYFKHAIVYPLSKNPSLDPSVLNNFRPISKLPFLLKILQKVANQLIAFMNDNHIFEKFQSGLRTGQGFHFNYPWPQLSFWDSGPQYYNQPSKTQCRYQWSGTELVYFLPFK